MTISHLIGCIGSTTVTQDLALVLECFTNSLKVLGGPTVLSQDLYNGTTEAIKHQLDAVADTRKNRTLQPNSEQIQQFGFTVSFERLDEDMETFVVERMERLLRYLDRNHPLLATAASVRAMSYDPGIDFAAIDDLVERLKSGHEMTM